MNDFDLTVPNLYKEKLMKNLADLNTFETSVSLRDRVKSYI